MTDLVRTQPGPGVRVDITPESAGWSTLAFSVLALEAGASHRAHEADREVAIVPIAGRGTVHVGTETFSIGRESVFTEMPSVVYAPPGVDILVQAAADFEFAIGSAPAEGRYQIRCFRPDEMKSELRGGGAAYRQVNHILAAPLPAERLILFEVYVPRGTWSGWAPHRHDGVEGSPYLEETYYFRLDPPDGFAMHRNWSPESDFDEVLVAHDGDVCLVPEGYHSSVACPSSHMYFLNYLAGELIGGDRVTPPCFHAAYTWIQDDWEAGAWTLPVTRP